MRQVISVEPTSKQNVVFFKDSQKLGVGELGVNTQNLKDIL